MLTKPPGSIKRENQGVPSRYLVFALIFNTHRAVGAQTQTIKISLFLGQPPQQIALFEPCIHAFAIKLDWDKSLMSWLHVNSLGVTSD